MCSLSLKRVYYVSQSDAVCVAYYVSQSDAVCVAYYVSQSDAVCVAYYVSQSDAVCVAYYVSQSDAVCVAYYVSQSDAVGVASSPDLIPAVPLVPGAGEVVEADRLIRCVHAWCYACDFIMVDDDFEESQRGFTPKETNTDTKKCVKFFKDSASARNHHISSTIKMVPNDILLTDTALQPLEVVIHYGVIKLLDGWQAVAFAMSTFVRLGHSTSCMCTCRNATIVLSCQGATCA